MQGFWIVMKFGSIGVSHEDSSSVTTNFWNKGSTCICICIYMRIYLHYMHFLIENNKVDQVQQRSLKKTTDFALSLRAFPLFIPIVLALMCCWYVLLLMCCWCVSLDMALPLSLFWCWCVVRMFYYWCVSLDMALPLPRLLLGHRSIEGRLSNTATPSPTICSWRWSCCCNTLKQTIILSC